MKCKWHQSLASCWVSQEMLFLSEGESRVICSSPRLALPGVTFPMLPGGLDWLWLGRGLLEEESWLHLLWSSQQECCQWQCPDQPGHLEGFRLRGVREEWGWCYLKSCLAISLIHRNQKNRRGKKKSHYWWLRWLREFPGSQLVKKQRPQFYSCRDSVLPETKWAPWILLDRSSSSLYLFSLREIRSKINPTQTSDLQCCEHTYL